MTADPHQAIRMQMDINLKMSINSKLSIASKSGYYLASSVIYSFEFDLLDRLLSEWGTTNGEEFNKSLIQIINKNLREFKEFISQSIPERREITDCIFDLYEQRNFIALIPLILSQVDGIMKQITGEYGFYVSKTQKMRYFENDFYFNFFSNYEQLNVENRNDYELFREKANSNEFNRHSILHGESYSYSSELNALKALLLLIFIAEINDAN